MLAAEIALPSPPADPPKRRRHRAPVGDPRRYRSLIAAALCNLGLFRLYVLPGTRKLIARSVTVARPHKVPQGAVLVGLYQQGGIASADVLEDVAELLQRLEREPPSEIRAAEREQPATVAEPAPAVATPKKIPSTTWHWAPPKFNPFTTD